MAHYLLTCPSIRGVEDVVGGWVHKGDVTDVNVGGDVEVVRVKGHKALVLGCEECNSEVKIVKNDMPQPQITDMSINLVHIHDAHMVQQHVRLQAAHMAPGGKEPTKSLGRRLQGAMTRDSTTKPKLTSKQGSHSNTKTQFPVKKDMMQSMQTQTHSRVT